MAMCSTTARMVNVRPNTGAGCVDATLATEGITTTIASVRHSSVFLVDVYTIIQYQSASINFAINVVPLFLELCIKMYYR